MRLSELETPCLVLDKGKVKNNIQAMRRHVERLGAHLRPHGKTAKSIDVMRLALDDPSGPITVSTLKEAEYFFGQGITDILYAVGIAPVKLDHVARLVMRGADLTIILDTIEQAKAASLKGRERDVTFPVLIEIDSDGHRSGKRADDPLLVELGQFLHQEQGVELRGVMTHAGGSYDCRNIEDIRLMAAQERHAALSCADALRRAGLPCPIVSIGSTPTAKFTEDLSRVTEVRSGVYMFYDLFMAGIGVCVVEDIALSVLASVIGYQKKKGWIITDAGWMALSRDRGTANQAVDQGYGLVCDYQGHPFSDVIVTATNQEHGIIAKRQGIGIDFNTFAVGSSVRILPNHACATGAMHDRYYVIDGTDEIIDVWDRINGWEGGSQLVDFSGKIRG